MSETGPPAPPERPAWSTLRARLEAAGFHPSRALGQNFLRDGNLARAIVRDARVAPGDLVLEVGPGCALLSWQLAELGVRLIAVEIDARLAALAAEVLAPFEQVRVLHADVLASKHRLAPAVLAELPREGPWHVVANLPYSAGTPFLVVAARLANPPRSQTVLLQRELVERLSARPGGKSWGPVGARLQLCYEVRVVRPVPRELFWPRPKVESAVARLELRPERPSPADTAAFDALVDGLFQARRKSLGARLGELLGDRSRALGLLAALGLDPRGRPEGLGVDELLALARATAAPDAPDGQG